LRNHST
jgi:uncharacterized protein YciI